MERRIRDSVKMVRFHKAKGEKKLHEGRRKRPDNCLAHARERSSRSHGFYHTEKEKRFAVRRDQDLPKEDFVVYRGKKARVFEPEPRKEKGEETRSI